MKHTLLFPEILLLFAHLGRIRVAMNCSVLGTIVAFFVALREILVSFLLRQRQALDSEYDL